MKFSPWSSTLLLAPFLSIEARKKVLHALQIKINSTCKMFLRFSPAIFSAWFGVIYELPAI